MREYDDDEDDDNVVSRDKKRTVKAKGKNKDKANTGAVARRLVEKAKAEARLFATPSGEQAFANVTDKGRPRTLTIGARDFRDWLTLAFFEATGILPGPQALASAIDVLAAYALQQGFRDEVHVRVAEHDGRLYIDLADDRGRVVEITRAGWSILQTTPPVLFIRPRGMLPLPAPERGGGRVDEMLKPFVKTTCTGDLALIIAWLLAALRPLPAYPPLAISGVQGAAKSTSCEFMRALVDPNIADLRSPPHDVKDLFIAARNAHVVAFDNIGRIQPWLSDALCRLSTGATQATRKLYSDGEEVFFRATRPVLLNSVAEIVRKPDLADRTLVIELERIGTKARRSKDQVRADFEHARPKILGGLCDLMVHGLQRLPSIKPPDLPRMADFMRWGMACLDELYHPTMFVEAYRDNRQAADDMVLDSSAVAAALVPFLQARPDHQWQGTATDLLKELKAQAVEGSTRDRDIWPADGKRLSDELKTLGPALETIGITIDRGREGKARTRLLFLSLSSSS